MKISACVITKNEADNIARCLESVRDSVDEMIVVDTGSSDETVNIARKLGGKVFHFQWVNDFSAARNFALDQAKGDWIIFLDADEYIATGKGPNLRPLLAKAHGNRKVEAVSCLMVHTEGLNGPLKARDRTVRIFRNSPSIRYKGRIHEAIYKHDRYTRSAHAAEAALVICHTGYNKEKLAEKVTRNHLLLEQSIRDGSADGMTYYYIGHSYWALRLHEKAVEYAQKAIADGMVLSSMFAHRVYVVLIESMLQLDAYRQEDVAPFAATAMRKYSHHPEVIKCQGLFERRFGYYTQALASLLHSLAVDERYDDISLANEFLIRLPVVHRNIAALYELMNNPVKALDHGVLAVKSNKYDVEAFAGLISLIRDQKAADIVWLLNTIYDLHNEADVEFLVNRLAAAREKRVFAYYEKIWAERFGHKDFTAMKFLLSGHPAQALPLFAAAARASADKAAEAMLAAAALLSERPPEEEAAKLLAPSCQKVIDAFFRRQERRELTAEDFPSYLELVKNCLHIADEKQRRRLLELGPMFPAVNGRSRLAALLVKERLYLPALALHKSQLDRPPLPPDELGGLYCQAGFCCYKLKDYEQAAFLFAQAMAVGFRGQEVKEYLAWSYEQCSNDAVKDKIKVLAERKEEWKQKS